MLCCSVDVTVTLNIHSFKSFQLKSVCKLFKNIFKTKIFRFQELIFYKFVCTHQLAWPKNINLNNNEKDQQQQGQFWRI